MNNSSQNNDVNENVIRLLTRYKHEINKQVNTFRQEEHVRKIDIECMEHYKNELSDIEHLLRQICHHKWHEDYIEIGDDIAKMKWCTLCEINHPDYCGEK